MRGKSSKYALAKPLIKNNVDYSKIWNIPPWLLDPCQIHLLNQGKFQFIQPLVRTQSVWSEYFSNLGFNIWIDIILIRYQQRHTAIISNTLTEPQLIM